MERHSKVHESSGSTSSTPTSSQSRSSSPPEQEYAVREDQTDHNPILSSLLSPAIQAANVDSKMLQWVYHSPFDSYQQLGKAVSDGTGRYDYNYNSLAHNPFRMEYLWNCDQAQASPNLTSNNYPLGHSIEIIYGPNDLKQENYELPKSFSNVTTVPNGSFGNHAFQYAPPRGASSNLLVEEPRTSNNYPLRHSIEVILGANALKEENYELPKSYSSVTTVPYGSFENPKFQCAVSNSLVEEPKDVPNIVHNKRQWKEEYIDYVPKKLRLSKRYQQIS